MAFAQPKNKATRNFLGQILVLHQVARADPQRAEAEAAAAAVAQLSGPAM